jgi:hypothetical protein
MKRAFLLLPALLAATPALATGGYSCSTQGKDPVRIDIVTGHGVAPAIAQVRLHDGTRSWSTADADPAIVIAQSWIDLREVRLDLVDAKVQRYEARLRVRTTNRLAATGTLERNGVKRVVRCEGEG